MNEIKAFKANDGGRGSSPRTRKQRDFAGTIAREIRDSGLVGDHSAHSIAKYFTIDTLLEMRDEIRKGVKIELKF